MIKINQILFLMIPKFGFLKKFFYCNFIVRLPHAIKKRCQANWNSLDHAESEPVEKTKIRQSVNVIKEGLHRSFFYLVFHKYSKLSESCFLDDFFKFLIFYSTFFLFLICIFYFQHFLLAFFCKTVSQTDNKTHITS